MSRTELWSSKGKFLPPPKVGAEFDGPPMHSAANKTYRPTYVVAAIVDFGFFDDEPTYFHVVFRWWARYKRRYIYQVESVHALDLGLYTPRKKARKKAA